MHVIRCKTMVNHDLPLIYHWFTTILPDDLSWFTTLTTVRTKYNRSYQTFIFILTSWWGIHGQIFMGQIFMGQIFMDRPLRPINVHLENGPARTKIFRACGPRFQISICSCLCSTFLSEDTWFLINIFNRCEIFWNFEFLKNHKVFREII